MTGQKLEEVTSFKNPGETQCKNGICSAEIRIRIASIMAAMDTLNKIGRCTIIGPASKFKVYKSLVTSILLYGYETWILLADSEKKEEFRRSKPSA